LLSFYKVEILPKLILTLCSTCITNSVMLGLFSNLKNNINNNEIPFFSLILAVSLAGCSRSATKINASIKTTKEEPKQFKRLAVLVLSPVMSNRAIIEIALDDKLSAMGVNSITTFDIFPFAGDRELLAKMDLQGDALRNKVKEKVKTHEIDALMIVSLLDAKQEERYVQGSSISVVGPAYYSAYPVYGYNYYDYYHYAYATIYDKGYYKTTTTYFVETNLYDTTTEKLIWTGQSETKDPDSIEKEANNYAKLIANELFTKNVIKK
jgi:hypothetical protein